MEMSDHILFKIKDRIIKEYCRCNGCGKCRFKKECNDLIDNRDKYAFVRVYDKLFGNVISGGD